MTTTPADEMRAAAERARQSSSTTYYALARLLDGYATDWEYCPADHPGTVLDEYTLAVARRVLGETTTTTEAGADGLRDRIDGAVRTVPIKYGDGIEPVSAEEAAALTDAVMAVLPTGADRAAEVEDLRAEVENDRRYIKRLDTEYDGLRAEWAELRAEVDRLRTDRAAVLREAADAVALDRDATSGAHSGAKQGMTRAVTLLRRLADEAQQDTGGGEQRPPACKCGHPQDRHVLLSGTYAQCRHRYAETGRPKCSCGMYRPQADVEQPAPAVAEEPTP